MKKIPIAFVLIIALVAAIGGTVFGSMHGTHAGFPVAKLKLNGQEATPPAPAVVINGTTYVPLRFVANALGAGIGWDQATETVLIDFEAPEDKPASDIYTVNSVVDGDTIKITYNGKEESVRLIGVDTPETVHPTKEVQAYGIEASDYTKAQLAGKQVRLEFDVEQRDSYGRLLAYVWIGDTLFNETLIAEGYGQVATFPPNVKYVERFTAAQKTARDASKGLWWIDGPITEPATPATTGTYVGSKESDKYHYPSCRWAKEIKSGNEMWFQTEGEAVKAGYQPCGVCKP